MRTVIISAAAVLIGVVGPVRSCVAQSEFEWERGWFTDGTSDWYVVREDDRVLMSTATRREDLTIAGLVFELDLSDPTAAKSRPYGSNGPWTVFDLAYDGSETFMIDGTPFTRAPDTNQVEDFDVREDTPPGRYGLFFLVNQLDQNGESLPDP